LISIAIVENDAAPAILTQRAKIGRWGWFTRRLYLREAVRQGRRMEFLSTPLAIGGTIAVAVAIIAWFGDRRRMRRSQPDAVGFMPWTGVFFWALLAAIVLLGLAVKARLAG
jgi:hypothetical protein